MRKRYIDLALIFIGLIGLVIFASISISESSAPDIASVIPVQLLFASLFVGGYVSYRHSDQK